MSTDMFRSLIETLITFIVDASTINPEYLTIEELDSVSGWISTMAGGIAMTLTAVYFLIELNLKMAMDATAPLRTYIGMMMKFGIAMILVGNGRTLTTNFAALGRSFITRIGTMDSTVGTAQVTEELESTISQFCEGMDNGVATFFMKLFILFFLCLGLIITWVISIIWIYKAISFNLEWQFRLGLYPFALADAYQGQSSTAVRYLKSLLAMGLYGAAFIFVPRAGSLLMIRMISMSVGDSIHAAEDDAAKLALSYVLQPVKALLACIAVPIAEIGCLGLCKQAAKEALA